MERISPERKTGILPQKMTLPGAVYSLETMCYTDLKKRG